MRAVMIEVGRIQRRGRRMVPNRRRFISNLRGGYIPVPLRRLLHRGRIAPNGAARGWLFSNHSWIMVTSITRISAACLDHKFSKHAGFINHHYFSMPRSVLAGGWATRSHKTLCHPELNYVWPERLLQVTVIIHTRSTKHGPAGL